MSPRSTRELTAIEDLLGPRAAEVMRAVWAQREATVGSVTAALHEGRRGPAYTTVMTLMARLTERGFLARVKVGKKYIYRATGHESALIEEMGRRAVDDLIGRYGTTAYRHFAQRLAEMDPDLRAKLTALAGDDTP